MGRTLFDLMLSGAGSGGGGGSGIGKFTKYEKKTLKFPNAANTNNWTDGAIVECSFTPKIVIFYGGDDTAAGTIIRGIFSWYDVNTGVVTYKNAANGSITQGGYSISNSATGSASRYKFDNGYFYATRVSANGWWSNSDEYTFEFYG